MVVPISACSGGTVSPGHPLTDFWLQNLGDIPAPFTVTDAHVTTASGDVPLIVDAVAQVEAPILAAAAYGRAHHVPVFLGEFGSSDEAPMDSRVRWARAVRTCAQQNGIATAWGSFDGNFALVDRSTGAPFPDLLAAVTAGA